MGEVCAGDAIGAVDAVEKRTSRDADKKIEVQPMRHVGTLIAAIAIGPLAWIMLAFGQERSARTVTDVQNTGIVDIGGLVRSMLLLAAAGLLLGLIGTLRFSPSGAVLIGILYAASYVCLLVDPKRLLGLFPHDFAVAGYHADLAAPLRTGTSLLLGALLLVAVVSVGRWRRWPQPTVEKASEAPERDRSVTDQNRSVPERDRLPDGIEELITRPESVTERATGPQRTGTDESRWSTLPSGYYPDRARR